jgi:uncharacterized membrane protein
MRPVRRPIFWIAAIGMAVASNLALTYALPNFVTAKAMSKFERAAAKKGQGITNRPTEKSRAVVKPNPDLLFGVCVFDPAKGSLGIRFRQPAGYWSIAVYRSDSTNAAVVSRRDNLPPMVALRVSSSAETAIRTGERVIAVGPDKSAVILRILPQNPANADVERATLETFRCEYGQDAVK